MSRAWARPQGDKNSYIVPKIFSFFRTARAFPIKDIDFYGDLWIPAWHLS
jgi:hypothetical protein